MKSFVNFGIWFKLYLGRQGSKRRAQCLNPYCMADEFPLCFFQRGDTEYGGDEGIVADGALEGRDDDWEDEANRLYEWTQELSFEDIAKTPRVVT